MRILILSQYFWPESFPINDVARGLRDMGHEVAVLTGKPNYPAGCFYPGYRFFGRGRERHEEIDVFRVPLVPRGGGGRVRLTLNYLSFAVSASALGPLRCRGGFDAILVYEPSPMTVGIPALLLKRLHGVPLLFWVQDLWPESLEATGAVRSRWVLSAVSGMVRAIYEASDLVLVQSRRFVPAIERFGIDRSRIRYLPNTAADTYRPVSQAEAAAERRLVPEGFVVMFAGNVGAAQGFETILDAAERLRDRAEIQWVVLGDGRRLEWLRAQVSERRLEATVHLLGRHPAESMPRFFALAGAMLVSLRHDPIFASTVPAKVPAYLACGRPVIAALEGEGASIIEEAGAGIVVPPDNAMLLAEAVCRMAAMSADERSAMGAHGRLYFEHHLSRAVQLERLSGWIADLVEGRAPSSGLSTEEGEPCAS